MNKYNKEFFTEIVKNSNSLLDICRKLQIGTTSGNTRTIKKYIKFYNIDISHFNINPVRLINNFTKKTINEILVENSDYNCGTHLKKRLYDEGLKTPICELCGQREEWRGKKMSLILDHKNGINDDNRLFNLQIVCPNCNATLDTHCGKNAKNKTKKLRKCKCGNPKDNKAKQCDVCFKQRIRKVPNRPTSEILIRDIKELGFSKTGIKYGVSDNTIRKWLRTYGINPNTVKQLSSIPFA